MFRACLTVVVSLAFLPLARGQATQPATRPATLPVVHVAATQPITLENKLPFTLRLDAMADPLKGTIRLRGSTSLGYPKKSYAIVLDTPAGFLGMPSRKNWILNAAYIDRSLMRHKLAYDLFRSLSDEGKPRHAAASRFVEVQLNGEYNGVYLLMEKVDPELASLAPYELNEPSPACIYKAVNHDAGFYEPGHGGFEQEIPDPLLLAHWKPLDDLLAFIHASTPQQLADPQNGIASMLDVDNAVDFHLLVLLTSNSDGITKNFYLARNRSDPKAPAKFLFIPWDYDGTFGRNWDSSPYPPNAWMSNGLFEKLQRDPAYRQRFAARWQELRKKQFALETIQAMIDDNARLIAEAAARNVERWPTDHHPYRGRLTFQEDVAQMKAWTAERVEWLDRTILRRR